MPGLGFVELLVLLVIIVLLFGVGRIGKIGKELGSAGESFRKGMKKTAPANTRKAGSSTSGKPTKTKKE